MHIGLLRVKRSIHAAVGVDVEGGLVDKRAPLLDVHCRFSRRSSLARMAVVWLDLLHGVNEFAGALPATLVVTLGSPISYPRYSEAECLVLRRSALHRRCAAVILARSARSL